MIYNGPIKKGSVDRSLIIRIVDSSDGTPETGVTSATGGLDLQYTRMGGTVTDLTESDLAAVDSAHSDGGMKHIGNGYYRVDVPDAAFATGAESVILEGTVTGMVVIGAFAQLVDNLAGELSAATIISLFSSAYAGTVRVATAQGGGAGTITLDASASGTDDAYNDMLLFVVSGTGALQKMATISDYVGATKVASLSPAPATNYANDSVFVIVNAPPVASTTDIANQVLTSADGNPIAANVKEVNDVALTGDGDGTPWGPA